ncbi:1-phosphofructokinase family hexose kinase [Corynebacterium gerontici]|uniref:Tagatose-6-phosphate kinase n=1 Tax=Corynebacterium gerontici TaxID=2079234 RepID=A0A3G6J3Q8_9CORY|nr:1-phosphofructokinase family hexose kinase [Corynebacterium gerontici]AZA11598.1 Tagatose-6-phosphate kinase [Corynebacterium gerontici]
MILSLTPNPSIDTTLSLPRSLERGVVHRVDDTHNAAGGKGVNVALAVHRAQLPVLALFPAAADDPFTHLVKNTGMPFSFVPLHGPVRVNTAVTEPDGTTTKLNGRGPTLNAEELAAVETSLLNTVEQAQWIVLAGSLPPGAPSDWYTQIVEKLKEQHPEISIAVDTSDGPLENLGRNLERAAPTLIKPNAFELGQLSGLDGAQLERDAERGELGKVIEAAQTLLERGLEQVLVTLGAAGAVLVTQTDAWVATPPPINVASTVGAGDCTLAGYLIGLSKGEDHCAALKRGVAYGSAATSLPGTSIPYPDQIDLPRTKASRLSL